MDDDDLRRGRPTSHKVFGEGMATLAGDGLLTLAFDLIATGIEDGERSRRIAAEISRAAGYPGMVGGQALDILQTGEVEEIHRRKTQALIAASLRSGAIAAAAGDDTIGILGTYGEKVGLAFQIADDLLDEEGTTEDLGKTAGKDRAQQKRTYPGVYGAARSRQMAESLIEDAKRSLLALETDTSLLASLADYILSRKR
jgi:geranylgeranyl diphosphate synthase type II